MLGEKRRNWEILDEFLARYSDFFVKNSSCDFVSLIFVRELSYSYNSSMFLAATKPAGEAPYIKFWVPFHSALFF